MEFTKKTAWILAITYVALVYGGLYFTPFISDYLKEREELGSFIDWSYAVAGFLLFGFFYFKLEIRKPEAYGMIFGLIILFFAAFSKVEISTDRLHFLEHGLIYLFVYLALRFSNEGVVLIGRAILLCILIGLVDEGIQGLLPNREAAWNDVWTNVFSYYLTAGLVGVASQYRRAA